MKKDSFVLLFDCFRSGNSVYSFRVYVLWILFNIKISTGASDKCENYLNLHIELIKKKLTDE